MDSRTTRQFREAFAALPEEVRQHARRAYQFFRADPRHSSLRFKKVDDESNICSVRIVLPYRALGVRQFNRRLVLDWLARRWRPGAILDLPPAGPRPAHRLLCIVLSRLPLTTCQCS